MIKYEDIRKFFGEDILPYNTFQEKNAIIESMKEESSPITIAKELGLYPRNNLEAEAEIFLARRISVGELIEISYSCGKCGHFNMSNVLIDDLFFQNGTDVIGKPYRLVEDILDLDDDQIENLSIDEYNDLEVQIYKNNLNIFNNKVKVKCRSCGFEEEVAIDYKSIISKFNIKNIYEQYLDITTYGGMTKSDVDTLYPFEREILLGIIQERENKKAQNN